jgi:type IV pilus assembly protein PilF
VLRLGTIVALALALVACVTDPDAMSAPERAAKSARIHTELAGAYLERGQYKIALEEANKALHADTGYSQAYNVRALTHMALQEDTDADRDFRRSLELDPANSDAQNNYGWFLCQHGDMDGAHEHLLKAAQDLLYAEREKAYLNIGVCARQSGSRSAAARAFQNALALHPESPQALVGLSELAFVGGDLAGAKSYFSRYERNASLPLPPASLLLAVRIERGLGNGNAASNYATQLTRNYPASREAQALKQVR